MKFVMEINCGNAAFRSDGNGDARREEIARILRSVAFDLETGKLMPFNLRDSNGNKVGVAGLVKTS